ncbi:MAG: hypothetical protein Q7R76_03460 [Candidatus Woesearchaeota archaeon]|nr:hypothetical protein [Candidatus Woesearchaeota archaeon]
MSDLVRVCAVAWSRIGLDGRLLLDLTSSRRIQGILEFAPLGGALEFHESARPFLKSIDAEFEKPETNDLRLYLPPENFHAFKDWYRRGEERETSPVRELREELTCYGLPDFSDDALQVERVQRICDHYTTIREGVAIHATNRLGEIFEVRFVPEYEQYLRTELKKPGTMLALASEREIRARQLERGTPIADASAYLLNVS